MGFDMLNVLLLGITVKACACQDTDFLVSTSEEREKTLAGSPKVGVKVPRTDNNGSESLSSKLR